VQLYDRDEAWPAATVESQFWPETFQNNSPATWGEIHFGNANFTPSPSAPAGEIEIRAASSTDNTVEDAWVGGGGLGVGGHLGGSETNHGDHIWLYTGSETAPTHFPFFNKSFLRFQLDAIPPQVGTIVSATLTLHLWGNAIQDIAPPFSWVHLFTLSDDWDEMRIHWNNAPLAQENISAIRVYPYSQPTIDWPGDPYNWDATQAVVEAYRSGEPVNLALYSSDSGRDTTKYFSSSEAGDWNWEARPVLKVAWAVPTVHKTGSHSFAAKGEIITFHLTWDGNGQDMSLTDTLPSGLSDPSNLTVNIGDIDYNDISRKIQWSGAPSKGETVTLSYQTTVLFDGPQVLTNTADLSDTSGLLSTDSYNIYIDYTQIYLPFIKH
jgi:hypothetical protein